MEYVECTEEEIAYLSSSDSAMASLIRKVGKIGFEADPDLHTSLVRCIIGQQISIPMYERIWDEFKKEYGEIPSPGRVLDGGVGKLKSLGIPTNRAEYILGISKGFLDGDLDQSAIERMYDDDAFRALVKIRGVGPWTAEMAMIFCLRRKNVFSFGDLALIRGIRRMYGLESVSKADFESYRKLFSPYCTAASLYIWEVGEGRVAGFLESSVKD